MCSFLWCIIWLTSFVFQFGWLGSRLGIYSPLYMYHPLVPSRLFSFLPNTHLMKVTRENGVNPFFVLSCTLWFGSLQGWSVSYRRLVLLVAPLIPIYVAHLCRTRTCCECFSCVSTKCSCRLLMIWDWLFAALKIRPSRYLRACMQAHIRMPLTNLLTKWFRGPIKLVYTHTQLLTQTQKLKAQTNLR